MDKFIKNFGKKPEFLFFAPGRTEIGGNHTDHQHGRVLAAAVDLDTRAYTARNDDGIIRIVSEGFPPFAVDVSDLSVKEDEKGTSAAIVRGVAARIRELTGKTASFDAYVTSTVLPGSGLSSSAAFEVLIATIINSLAGCSLSAPELAKIGQYAENVYFGKPCGLMDQTASAVGNIITIDFKDPETPVIEKLDFDFSKSGYSLCIVDSGADHMDLTDEYAAIPGEISGVCAVFGKKFLRDVSEEEFYANLSAVRKAVGDRATLRAMHVFAENKRVNEEVEALRNNDFERFLKAFRKSGESSFKYLQNVIPSGNKEKQDLALAIALSEKLLAGRGASRVHGGGFAGTMQAFVPNEMLSEYKRGMEAVLGKGKCHVLSVRAEGSGILEVL